MAISLIPKEASYQRQRAGPAVLKVWLRKNILVVGASVILLATLAVYGGLFAYENALEGRIAETRQAREALLAQADTEKRIAASNFALRAEELQNIIAGHNAPTQLLRLFEETTHPAITVISFAFSFDRGEVRVEGRSSGYSTLAEQILIWEEDPAVHRVEVSDFSTNTAGLLAFKATLSLAGDAYAQP